PIEWSPAVGAKKDVVGYAADELLPCVWHSLNALMYVCKVVLQPLGMFGLLVRQLVNVGGKIFLQLGIVNPLRKVLCELVDPALHHGGHNPDARLRHFVDQLGREGTTRRTAGMFDAIYVRIHSSVDFGIVRAVGRNLLACL